MNQPQPPNSIKANRAKINMMLGYGKGKDENYDTIENNGHDENIQDIRR